MESQEIPYNLSGAFASGAVTNIGPSGITYELPNYGKPNPSQQFIGSVLVVTSIVNGVEKSAKSVLKIDRNDSDQLDVYVTNLTLENRIITKEKVYLPIEEHQPPFRVSGTSKIFNVVAPGFPSGAAIIVDSLNM